MSADGRIHPVKHRRRRAGLSAETTFKVNVCPCGQGELRIDLYAVLTVTGEVGKKYQLEYQASLNAGGPWEFLAEITLAEPRQLFIDLTGPATASRFYRVRSAE